MNYKFIWYNNDVLIWCKCGYNILFLNSIIIVQLNSLLLFQYLLKYASDRNILFLREVSKVRARVKAFSLFQRAHNTEFIAVQYPTKAWGLETMKKI